MYVYMNIADTLVCESYLSVLALLGVNKYR